MEVVSSEIGNFHVINTPERSPTQSPLSNSPSPEQHHSPRGSAQEQSLHIIVEPQIDGQTNIIHLMNPPSGPILSSFIAENGVHIEIQPGVFFRVPFPHEHGYPYATPPMHIQPQAYQSHFPATMAPHITADATLHDVAPQTFVYNPACAVHAGQFNGNNMHCNEVSSDERVEKQREKLQKKLREKNATQQCTCIKGKNGFVHDNFYMQHGGIKGNVMVDKDVIIEDECTDLSLGADIVLQASAASPYSIIISWEDTIATTNIQIYYFQLELANKGNNFKCIYTGEAATFTADDLAPGIEYRFRLCVVLSGGQYGPYTEIVSCATPCTVPDRPHIPRIIHRTKNVLTLKWNTPADGGSPITQYKLQWSKGEDLSQFSDLYTGLQKQYKHNHKLPPNSTCMFRIQAENQYGPSDFSEPLECLTSAGLPGVPEKPMLDTFGIDYIKLKWTQPECNGAPIEEYRLEMEDPNEGYGFMTKYCGEKTSYTCTNLWRNTTYKFRISASNNQGSSKCSPVVEYSTLAETPGKMEKPKINGKVKTHTIPVKWEPPKDNGGDEITGYILQMDDGGGGGFEIVYNGPDLEFTMENLKGGTSYQFQVASESRAGTGPFSPSAVLTTLPVSPRNISPPRLAKQDMTALYLEWDPPAETGGSPITNYIMKMAETPKDEFKQVYSGEKLNCFISGLECGCEYFFKLQATNSVGPSPWSKIVPFQTIPGPPDAITSLVVSFKSPTHIRFDWTEPDTHGAAITGYCVEKLESEVFQKVYEGNCLYCEVKRNIEPANVYFFRIQALSNAGGSAYSNICTVETPPGPPGPVTDIKVIEQTSSSCLIQWRNPVENGSEVYEYVIEATGATSLVCTVKRPTVPAPDSSTTQESTTSAEGTTSTHSDDEVESDDERDISSASSDVIESTTPPPPPVSTTPTPPVPRIRENLIEYRLTGLTADASYKLRIQAVNEVGASPFSHVVHFFTKELPPSPPTLNASSISYHSIKLKWGDSSSKKSSAGVGHNVQVQDKCGSFSTVYYGMGTSFTLNRLKELSPYCCRIRSKNDAGEGEYSKPKTFYTKAQPPSAIKELRSKEVRESAVVLTWNKCEKIRPDDNIQYIAQRLHQDHEKDFSMVYRGTNNECKIDDLQADQIYHFRVQAVRLLSESACQDCPTPTHEMKGIYSPVIRVKTMCEQSVKQECDDDASDTGEEECDVSERMSDTQIAILILGSFLVICILTVIMLRVLIV